MSEALLSNANDPPLPPPPDRVAQGASAPLDAYLGALGRYEGLRLYEIRQALGLTDPPGNRPRVPGAAIADRLAEPRAVEALLHRLPPGPRLALGLAALTETTAWPLSGLSHALACLGAEATTTLRTLADLGLVALSLGPEAPPVGDFGKVLAAIDPSQVVVLVHPAATAAARTVLPDGPPLPTTEAVRQVRETDGLEPILRLGAVWQRVDESPLRQTQQGTLYKRDRDRLEDDPVLAGPIADALEPLPDMAAFWLTLARAIGLLAPEPGSDRLIAAPPDFWAENAYHLPQMVANRWLTLRHWHEQGGMTQEGSTVELALPYVRAAALLWLATIAEGHWVALDDLDRHLRSLAPAWDRTTFAEVPAAPASPPGRGRPVRGRAESRYEQPGRPAASAVPGTLAALLLGAAYQIGLVRAAEEVPSGRRVAQLTPLGRYILALGPPPPPRPAFEHFLFVQPNFEMIAYRQGLTPPLIGQFSRFARWSQIGAALELKLTPESVYHGLEGGMTTLEMLDRLARHSQRPLPTGVAEALRTWADRRDRVTYHASATLIEFASHAELEQALALWPRDGRVEPVAISDRLLLVEDESAIPFQRFRQVGARDYRRAPEVCLEVESDGVTLGLDLGRSDLLVDAELARFTDELPFEPAHGAPGNPRRRFRVSSESLARGLANGLSPALLAHWYQKRSGAPTPPAVHLLLAAAGPRVPTFATSRPLILHTPTAELLDGLMQHPDTEPHLGDRLGPATVIVPDESVPALRRALEALGLTLPDPIRIEDGPERHKGTKEDTKGRR